VDTSFHDGAQVRSPADPSFPHHCHARHGELRGRLVPARPGDGQGAEVSGYDYQFRIIEGRHVAGYMENYQEAMGLSLEGLARAREGGPSAPRARKSSSPAKAGNSWRRLQEHTRPQCNASGEVFFADTSDDKSSHRLDGKVSVFADKPATLMASHRRGWQALHGLGEVGQTHELRQYGHGELVLVASSPVHRRHAERWPLRDLNDGKANAAGSVWFIKDGKKRRSIAA